MSEKETRWPPSPGPEAKPRTLWSPHSNDPDNEPVRKGLAEHLLIGAGDQEIARALELSSFEKAKEQEQAKGYRERPIQSAAFFREGRAGQWREVLSPAQVIRIVQAHGEQMARFGYLPEGV